MEPITAALAAGAAAGLTAVASQAIKDAYGRLKAALAARFPEVGVNVQALEARPDSQAKQASLAEELVEVGAERDAELLQLAQALVKAIEREAPQAAARVGVDLERIKAEFLNMQRVTGSVRVRDAETTGGMNITDIGSAGGPDPN
jgi:uncharacterized protein (DUF885 family)